MLFNWNAKLQVLVVVSLVASVTLVTTASTAEPEAVGSTAAPEVVEQTTAAQVEQTAAATEVVEQTAAAPEVVEQTTTAAPEVVEQTTTAPEVEETTGAEGGGDPQTDNPNQEQTNVTESQGGDDVTTEAQDPGVTSQSGSNQTEAPSGVTQEPDNGQSGSNQTEAPSGVTQEPDNGNTTSGSNSTQATPTYCFFCDDNSTDCDTERGASHDTCVSNDNFCWMTFDLSTNTAKRSCDPLAAGESGPSCDSAWPNGNKANEVCEYCCKGGKCNTNTLTAELCSAATRIALHSSSLTVLLTIVSFLYSN